MTNGFGPNTSKIQATTSTGQTNSLNTLPTFIPHESVHNPAPTSTTTIVPSSMSQSDAA